MYPWGQSKILLDDDCLKLQLNTDFIIAKISGAFLGQAFRPTPSKVYLMLMQVIKTKVRVIQVSC